MLPPTPRFRSSSPALIRPQPDAEGVALTREFVLRSVGRALSDEQARQLLEDAMARQYLLRRLANRARSNRGAPVRFDS